MLSWWDVLLNIILILLSIIFFIGLFFSGIIVSRACYEFNCFEYKTRCRFCINICKPCCLLCKCLPKTAIINDEDGSKEFKLLKQASRPNVTKQITAPVRYTTSVSMFSFILSTLLYFGWIILTVYDNDSDGEYNLDDYEKYEEIIIVSYLLYYCGKITMYTLFILRLYYSFQGSIYSINNCIFISMVLFVGIVVVLLICYSIDIMVDIDEHLFGAEIEAFESTWFLFFVIDVFLSSIILYLFVTRLQLIGMYSYALNFVLIIV